ncbi:hypothetical protein NXW47_25655 [Bacteroides thetaiotaomicron]|uniref:hypothetical protein n=1 Tax=Bacteroides thetaiotaomicron TaxID=818 RepID=UPI0021661A2E|nr:hypothetical protein [Bacteroides thetaiotaomicron]MCS2468195.1 hypothetical protein [Bacteroides thetaiotaomicron]
MSISNVVGARIAGGGAAVQSSGQPGSDNATLTMRGQTGIVYVIDGIRRTSADFNDWTPKQIGIGIYSERRFGCSRLRFDANGVFNVTTKQGKAEKCSSLILCFVGFSQNAEQQNGWMDLVMLIGTISTRTVRRLSGIYSRDGAKMRDERWVENTNWHDMHMVPAPVHTITFQQPEVVTECDSCIYRLSE